MANEDKSSPDIDPNAALTELAAGMTQLHELYQSAVDAGFTEHQAMSMILEMIRGGATER